MKAFVLSLSLVMAMAMPSLASGELLQAIESRTGLKFEAYEAAIEKRDARARSELFGYLRTHPLDELKNAMQAKLSLLETACPRTAIDGPEECRVELDFVRQELARLSKPRRDPKLKVYLAALAFHNQLKEEVLKPFSKGSKFERAEIEKVLNRSRDLLTKARKQAFGGKVVGK